MVSQYHTKMSRYQSKLTAYTEKQEDIKLNEKRKSIDANTNMTKLLELSTNILKLSSLKYFNKQLWKTNEKVENLSKEIECRIDFCMIVD